MNSHIPPSIRMTAKERKAFNEAAKETHEQMLTEFRKLEKKVQYDASARTIILCVYTAWRILGIGPERMPKYIVALEEDAARALSDDTWVEEMCAAIKKHTGIAFDPPQETGEVVRP